MMKALISIIVLLTFSFGVQAEKYILEKLQQVAEISGIREMNVSPFSEYYEFWYEQPLDHENPSAGTFKQRVLLGHKKEKAPVIVELEGYGIWTEEEGELANLLKGNQLTVEHRFFEKSVPAGEIPWQYLTIKQAAADHHAIIQTLKAKLYPRSKWVTTGISKGGQTTIFHRYFYPEDADVSVPYVAPLNLKEVDPRIERFLNKAGANKKNGGTCFSGMAMHRKTVFTVSAISSCCALSASTTCCPFLRDMWQNRGILIRKSGE